MHQPDDLAQNTWAITAGRPHTPGSPMNVPIVPASNLLAGTDRSYTRSDGTPTWEALEDIVGGLEHGSATAFASGMAAAAAVFDLLAVGARVAIPTDCYHGVAHLADAGDALGRWSVNRIAVDDTAAWTHAAHTHDLLWIESPTNPMLMIADLPAIASVTRSTRCMLAVDNTFATPLNQQPLTMGADVVVHSATKFLGGHSDLLAGITITHDASLHERLRAQRSLTGAAPGALEAYLATRGIRTLGPRLQLSQANAMELATRLESHPQVDVVRYPGLASHPQHDIARRVMRGFGSVVSFDVRGGAAPADAVCAALGIVRSATSLGGVESTIERRAALAGQEHVPPGLLRLSVGCEDVDDLWRDLDSALAGSQS